MGDGGHVLADAPDAHAVSVAIEEAEVLVVVAVEHGVLDVTLGDAESLLHAPRPVRRLSVESEVDEVVGVAVGGGEGLDADAARDRASPEVAPSRSARSTARASEAAEVHVRGGALKGIGGAEVDVSAPDATGARGGTTTAARRAGTERATIEGARHRRAGRRHRASAGDVR